MYMKGKFIGNDNQIFTIQNVFITQILSTNIAYYHKGSRLIRSRCHFVQFIGLRTDITLRAWDATNK